jgi:aspartate kinase
MTSRSIVVLKFGGEALAEPPLVVRRVQTLLARGHAVVVVVSARAGVTDLLRDLADAPPEPGTVARRLERLRASHPGLPPSAEPVLRDLRRVLARARRASPVSPALRDEITSAGERLSARWFERVLRAGGTPAKALDADRLGLVTDNHYGSARVLLEPSDRPVRRRISALLARGITPVVTGFFGRSREGRVATLGRGGSDYSASALAAILRAKRVELVKSRVAISTADPRLVPSARPVAHLSYEEAEEIAQFGAKVLHPVTIEPAASRRVEVRVRSLNHRELLTTIGPARAGEAARAVTLLGPLRLLNVRIAGGRQRPGLVAEIGRRLQDENVNLAAVVTTEAVLGLLVEPRDARRARRALLPWATEYGAVLGHPMPVSLVSAVGEGILRELPRVPPSVLRSAGGLLATARSISIVVPQSRALSVLRRMHTAFVRPTKRGARSSAT